MPCDDFILTQAGAINYMNESIARDLMDALAFGYRNVKTFKILW